MISAEDFLARHARHIGTASASGDAVPPTVPGDGIVASSVAEGDVAPSSATDGDAVARAVFPGAADAVTEETTDASDREADVDECREAALRLLDAAPRPSGALRRRLLDKGYADDVVDEVIERLTRVRLLDDRAYAESAVRYCTGRLMGRRGTVTELTRKGVSRDLAEQVAAEAESRGDFEDAVWELGRRYAGRTRGLDPAVRRRRFWSAGGRKGHSPDALRRVAEELFRQ